MEHLLAKGIDKAIQFVHKRRVEAAMGDGDPFVVAGNLRRFSALASMVSGRELEVVDLRGDTPPRPYWQVLYKTAHPALLPEHGFGWSDGETLFLPVSVVEFAGDGAREEAARALVFFLSYQVRGGALDEARGNRGLLTTDRMVADLFWIIENARLCVQIREEYPGALRNWPSMAGFMLERRPRGGCLNEPEKKVEEYLAETVRASFPASGRECQSKSARESLALAVSLKKRWVSAGLKTARYRAVVPFFPWGKLVVERIKDPGDLPAVRKSGKQPRRAASASEAAHKKGGRGPRYSARKEEVDEKANENGLTLNIYDKLLSWAEFVNVRRPFDDDPDDDAGKKADECEELSVSELERSTANTFNAELEKAGESGGHPGEDEPAEEAFTYPEWDYRKRAYIADHARLVESAATGEDGGFCASVLVERRAVARDVRRRLEAFSPSIRLVGRQSEGTSIDLNAAVDAMADLEAGHTPDERLYSSYVKTQRDLAALFLVDLSMSTDGWANGARIIEHEKEALVILCEALRKLRDRYAIYGFSGKGRRDCRFFRVKGFQEAYGDEVRGRIGGLIPYSYTRMGPAIRHASAILSKEKARARLMFILSDGKPNDVDVYEGRYGVEDTRKAIKEAEAAGVTPFCLTVDTGAAEYLPRIFGRGNYAVVPGVDTLAKKLPELYARIIHRL